MSTGGAERIASAEELEDFVRLPEPQQHLTPRLKGALAEVATSGLVRYSWRLLRPVLEVLLDDDIVEFEATSSAEVGPPRPLPGGETPAQLRKRLKGLLRDFEGEAPFTLQRLCELLLEPSKQYTRLDKLAVAVEKLLMVTSTVVPAASVPESPLLSALPPVNENPPPPARPTANGPARMGPRESLANGAAPRVSGDTFSHAAAAAFGEAQQTDARPAAGDAPQAQVGQQAQPVADSSQPEQPRAGAAAVAAASPAPSSAADVQPADASRQGSDSANVGPAAGAHEASLPVQSLPASEAVQAPVVTEPAAAGRTAVPDPVRGSSPEPSAPEAPGTVPAQERGEREGSVPPAEAAAGVPDADGRQRGAPESEDDPDAQPPAKRPAIAARHDGEGAAPVTTPS